MMKYLLGLLLLVAVAGRAVSTELVLLDATLSRDLQAGDAAASFRPWHVTGPLAGRTACPLCVYGQRPQLAIWTRPRGLADAVQLAAALDSVLSAAPLQQAQGYVVLLPDASTPREDAERSLRLAFAGSTLQRVFLTIAEPQANRADVERYRIDPALRTQTLAIVNRVVARTFANLEPGAGVAPLLRETLEPLYALEEPYAESAVSLCADDEPGERIDFWGRVLDAQGQPLAKAAVVAYNTDRSGSYAPRGSGTRNPRIRGVAVTDDGGWYRFATVKPGSYPGTDNPAHIHLTVAAPMHQIRYVTFWFDSDPLVTERARAGRDAETVIVALQPRAGGRSSFRHDIALGES